MILIENCTVLDDENNFQGYNTGQHIVINGNTIEAITETRPEQNFERVISGQGLLAMPGLVNAHTHSPENYMRGTTEKLPLEPWLATLVMMSGAYTPRDHYLNVMLGAIEMVRSGVTSVVDHLWSPILTPEILDTTMQSYRNSGLRAAVAPLYRDVHRDAELGIERGHPLNDTFYGQFPKNPMPLPDLLAMLEDFFNRWHLQQGGRLRCLVGPCGLQWCSEALLQASLDLTRRYNGGMHMHLLETRVQDWACQQYLNSSGVKWLAERDLLGGDVSLPHSVWVNRSDLELIREKGAIIVHTPAANLKLGSGLAPVPDMLELGIPVALGTDGAASNDNQRIFDTMRLAALIHCRPEVAPDRWISARQAFRMATEYGASVLGNERLGKLKSGFLADLVLLKIPFLNNAYRHLVFCEPGIADTVIIDGQVVMYRGEIEIFDEEEILKEAAQAVAERLYHRSSLLPDNVQADADKFLRFNQDIVHDAWEA